MHSVFIVDDEIIVREGIREKIDWDQIPFTLAGEAGDGEIAFSMIQDIKPDILVTDIKMPFMDGLELARLAKKTQPWIRVIILSGHDEFEFAKKSISIGVEDYILKPFSADDLLSSLSKVAEKIDAEKKLLDDTINLKMQLESSINEDREKFLTQLVLGDVPSEDIVQKSLDMDIDISGHYFISCVCNIHVDAENFGELYKVKSRLMDLSTNFENTIGFSFSLEKFIFIVKCANLETVEDDMYGVADAAIHQVEEFPTCVMTVAFGEPVERFSNISQSYLQAEKILQKKFALPRKNFIANINFPVFSTETENIVASENVYAGSDGIVEQANHIDEYSSSKNIESHLKKNILTNRDPLTDRLRYASLAEVDKIVGEMLEMLDEDNVGDWKEKQFDIIASYLVVDLIVAASAIIAENGGEIGNVMPEIFPRNFVIHAVSSRKSFIEESRRIIECVINFRDENASTKHSDAILKAKKYIADNFANPDISLQTVAKEIALSPNHFSAVFSQECGTTFIAYLTKVRVEQAKKMLRTTNKKSSDICYDVGFCDPHYFSFIFKKTTGMSPKNYRQSADTEN